MITTTAEAEAWAALAREEKALVAAAESLGHHHGRMSVALLFLQGRLNLADRREMVGLLHASIDTAKALERQEALKRRAAVNELEDDQRRRLIAAGVRLER